MRAPSATLAIGLIVAGACLPNSPNRPTSVGATPQRSALLALLGERRPVAGRLLGAPAAAYDGNWSLPPGSRSQAARLVREIEQQSHTAPSPANLADAALTRLVISNPKRATALLEQARSRWPDEHRLLNELTVAWLELHRKTGEATHLVLALDTIERAHEVGPTPEVAFNRALVLERLGLRRQAATAWQVAAGDADGGWATEAREHLRQIRASTSTERFDACRERLRAVAGNGDRTAAERIVRELPAHVRAYLQDDLLPEWAHAVLSGNEKHVASAQRLLVDLANMLVTHADDPLLRDTVTLLANARGAQRSALARAHLAFAAGKAAYDHLDVDAAVGPLEQAESQLIAEGSPFALWVAYHRAGCAYYRRDYDEALSLLRPLVADAGAAGYRVLHGRALIVEGVINLEKGAPSVATSAFREALVDFERTRELNYEAQVATLLANSARFVGEGDKAWNHRLRALRLASSGGFLQRLPISLGEAARAASLEGHYRAALAFLAEALAILHSDPKSEPVFVAEAYWWRAMVLHRAGKETAAQADIERALRACERIQNLQLRAQDVSGIQVTAGAILRATDPAASVRHLTAALERHRRLTYRYLLVDAYLERGRAYRALGNRLAAQADFVAAIEEYERSRRALDGPRVRATYFDQARDLLDETIALAIELDPTGASALTIAERGRAQGLLDALTTNSGKPSPDDESIAAAQAELPAGTALIVYSVLPRESVAWILTSRQSSLVRLRAGAAELDRRVGDLRRALIEGRPTSAHEDEVLFDLLLRPLASNLDGVRSLVIVPDRALHGLPFAVLRDTTNGQTLTESRSFSVAPSVRIYTHSLRSNSRPRQAGMLKVLSVADPAIDRRSYPNLAALRGAAGEGARIVERFPGSLLLTGASATPARFLAELNEHDMVVFSGHAVVDAERPERSRLLLAPATGEPGTGDIFAGDIARHPLKRPRLIVLAACSTAGGRWGALEGSTSLAIPFLAAGAPLVLGSLWPVDDVATAAFMDTFQERLAAGVDAETALRSARQRLRKSGDPRLNRPGAWAAFQLIGAAHPKRIEEERQ